PPGWTFISLTVQVKPSGPNHWQKASASVQAANTAARVVSRTRTRTISRSRDHVVGSDGGVLMVSPLRVWLGRTKGGGRCRDGRAGVPMPPWCAQPMRRSRPGARAAGGTVDVARHDGG